MLLKICVIYSFILIASIIWMWKETNHKDSVCPACLTKCNYLSGGICQACDEEKKSYKALL